MQKCFKQNCDLAHLDGKGNCALLFHAGPFADTLRSTRNKQPQQTAIHRLPNRTPCGATAARARKHVKQVNDNCGVEGRGCFSKTAPLHIAFSGHVAVIDLLYEHVATIARDLEESTRTRRRAPHPYLLAPRATCAFAATACLRSQSEHTRCAVRSRRSRRSSYRIATGAGTPATARMLFKRSTGRAGTGSS